jgi:hypothetical protein
MKMMKRRRKKSQLQEAEALEVKGFKLFRTLISRHQRAGSTMIVNQRAHPSASPQTRELSTVE